MLSEAAASVPGEVPLRLLRHYTSSIRHQQYHDIDILTLWVESVGVNPHRNRGTRLRYSRYALPYCSSSHGSSVSGATTNTSASSRCAIHRNTEFAITPTPMKGSPHETEIIVR